MRKISGNMKNKLCKWQIYIMILTLLRFVTEGKFQQTIYYKSKCPFHAHLHTHKYTCTKAHAQKEHICSFILSLIHSYSISHSLTHAHTQDYITYI